MKGTCLTCGRTFDKARSSRKYCCKECQSKAQIKPKPIAVCQTCGKTFTVGRDSKGLYCSRECQHESMKVDCTAQERKKMDGHYMRQYKDMKRWIMGIGNRIEHNQQCVKQCVICGALFDGVTVRSRFCSDSCFKRYDNARRDKRIYRNGQPDLSISLTKLYIRDGGVCQLCGRNIDFDCDSNSDDYPSIDHIIPLAKGGLHEWDNVQLACRKCNTHKGDTLV